MIEVKSGGERAAGCASSTSGLSSITSSLWVSSADVSSDTHTNLHCDRVVEAACLGLDDSCSCSSLAILFCETVREMLIDDFFAASFLANEPVSDEVMTISDEVASG